MRRESGKTVTHRRGSDFAVGLVFIVLWTVVTAAALIAGTGPGRGLTPVLLVAGVFSVWRSWINPRVELHHTYLVVITPLRRVRLEYDEIRSAEFDGSHMNTGPLLRLIGRADRVTVWQLPSRDRPPSWQVELRDEIVARMS